MTIQIISKVGMLSYTIIKPEGDLPFPCNDTLGLLGNVNGDPLDDFVNTDGTFVPVVDTLSSKQIYDWSKQCKYL